VDRTTSTIPSSLGGKKTHAGQEGIFEKNGGRRKICQKGCAFKENSGLRNVYTGQRASDRIFGGVKDMSRDLGALAGGSPTEPWENRGTLRPIIPTAEPSFIADEDLGGRMLAARKARRKRGDCRVKGES